MNTGSDIRRAFHFRNTWHLFVWLVALLAIAGFGLISYDDDFLDNNEPPVFILQYLLVVVNAFLISELIKISAQTVVLPFISGFSLLNRAPPRSI